MRGIMQSQQLVELVVRPLHLQVLLSLLGVMVRPQLAVEVVEEEEGPRVLEVLVPAEVGVMAVLQVAALEEGSDQLVIMARCGR
jgi:hypothetical protein